MPLVRVYRIVVNPMRRAERCPAVGAAREHHVRTAPGRANAGYHVNVVVRRAARAVDRQEHLACKSAWVNGAAEDGAAAHVHCCDLIKRRRDVRVLRVARADTPEIASLVSTANKEVAVRGHVECSPNRTIGNTDRTLPGSSAIGGAAEAAEVAGKKLGPKLVLEAVTHAAGGPVEREPLLVAAVRTSVGRPLRPRLSTVRGAPDITTKCIYQQAEIEEIPNLIGVCYRVAAEDVVLQNAWEMPRHTCIGSVAIAGLPEVRGNRVKLSPPDRDLVAVRRVN